MCVEEQRKGYITYPWKDPVENIFIKENSE